jgi:glycosyltransferase involved in cell wall biosynthesis
MRVAILGTRGVPPAYGGFETFAAELGRRLVGRGHEVTVYCRCDVARPLQAARGGLESPPPRSWEGIQRIVLPALPHKYLETVSHTFLSALDALRRDFDAVLLCNAANAFVLPLLRAARLPVAINVDGIERKRRKWNALGRAVYAVGESFSVVFANEVVADAEVIADYYRRQYAIEPVMISYGADFPVEDDSDVLERLGIEGAYILYVSRFEPENNPLEVVQAYEKLADAPPLVMLGSGLYAPELVAELHRHAGPRVIFPGALYGADYRTLQRNALLYIQATEVGGTHPAMIEAMASNGAVLAHDTPENREVGGDAVGYFRLRPEETLSGMLREWLRSVPDRERARQRAAERYSWDAVTDRYEQLLLKLA